MKPSPLVLLLLLLLGCNAAEPPTPTTTAVPFSLPAGFAADPLPYSFNRPTQFLVVDETLWVAQLNGGENEGRGQVVRIDLPSGTQSVVLDGLDKPTGLALVDNALWVATRDALLKAALPAPATAETVLADLPNNGRSNGTLTVTPDGRLLFETSGNRREAESGKLWALDPQTGERHLVASGLKGAYAHAFDAGGRLWITEVADGSVGGVTLPDEINLVVEGADFGWPRCYGREPAGPDCSGVRPAVTTFAAHSTPTGIAVSPFAADTLLVALWVTGDVVAVPFEGVGDNARGEVQPFITGMNNPQHLVARPDGSVWVSDYALGKIYRIYRE